MEKTYGKEMSNEIPSSPHQMRKGGGIHGESTASAAERASEYLNNFRSASGDVVREGVTFIKRYPVHTAIGAVAVGFLAGMWVRRK